MSVYIRFSECVCGGGCVHERVYGGRLSIALVACQLNRNIGLVHKHSFFVSHMTVVSVWRFDVCHVQQEGTCIL